MGSPLKPFHAALDFEGKEEMLHLCGPLPLLIKQRRYRNGVFIAKRSRRISSRRNLLEGSRKSRNIFTKRVKILRKLVPSTKPMALDVLFRDASNYIVALQLRVKLMKDLVDMLADSDE